MVHLEGHSTVLYHDVFYFFGGKDHISGLLLNDVWKCEVNDALFAERMILAKVRCEGAPPSPRAYHSAAIRGQFMIVIGGFLATSSSSSGFATGGAAAAGEEPGSVYFDPATGAATGAVDLVMFALNLEQFVWTKYYVPGRGNNAVPRPRYHATLVSSPDSILLYGGFPSSSAPPTSSGGGGGGGGGSSVVKSILKELAPDHWKVFAISAQAEVKPLTVRGNSPMLWGHSAVFCHNCLVVFGGIDAIVGSEVGSVAVYHVGEERWRWAEFSVSPEPRALHTAALHGSMMYVFGGFSGRADLADAPQLSDTWKFSLNTGLWEEVACTGDPPQPRSGHTCIITEDKMFVFAGLEGLSVDLPSNNTCAILDLNSLAWTTKEMELDTAIAYAVQPFTTQLASDPKKDSGKKSQTARRTAAAAPSPSSLDSSKSMIPSAAQRDSVSPILGVKRDTRGQPLSPPSNKRGDAIPNAAPPPLQGLGQIDKSLVGSQERGIHNNSEEQQQIADPFNVLARISNQQMELKFGSYSPPSPPSLPLKAEGGGTSDNSEEGKRHAFLRESSSQPNKPSVSPSPPQHQEQAVSSATPVKSLSSLFANLMMPSPDSNTPPSELQQSVVPAATKPWISRDTTNRLGRIEETIVSDDTDELKREFEELERKKKELVAKYERRQREYNEMVQRQKQQQQPTTNYSSSPSIDSSETRRRKEREYFSSANFALDDDELAPVREGWWGELIHQQQQQQRAVVETPQERAARRRQSPIRTPSVPTQSASTTIAEEVRGSSSRKAVRFVPHVSSDLDDDEHTPTSSAQKREEDEEFSARRYYRGVNRFVKRKQQQQQQQQSSASPNNSPFLLSPSTGSVSHRLQSPPSVAPTLPQQQLSPVPSTGAESAYFQRLNLNPSK